MKKSLYSIAIIASIILFVISCSKDDNSLNPSSESTSEFLKTGKWKITLLNDDGKDETYHFVGYEFTFESNNKVVATKNTSTVEGTWSTVLDDSKHKLVLNFGEVEPFDELNDDWDIIENSANKIKLRDVSGGNGGTDLLTFEKI